MWVKLDFKRKNKNQIDFNLTGEHNTDVQKSLDILEAKYKAPAPATAHGLAFVEKWNTDNILKSELTVEGTLFKGLKSTLDTSFAPTSGLVLIFVVIIYLVDLILFIVKM